MASSVVRNLVLGHAFKKKLLTSSSFVSSNVKTLMASLTVCCQNKVQIHTQTINKNLVFKSNQDDESKDSSNSKRNPVVMVLSWLMSKEQHLEKYEEMYTSQGFDVLMVKLAPMQVMFPTKGSQLVARQAADWLVEHKEYTDITIHAFSVGGYLFGEFLKTIYDNQRLYDNLANRIKGQVFDSIVNMQRLPIGFSLAVSDNRFIGKCLETYVRSHLFLMSGLATKHYMKSEHTFCKHGLNVPTVFFMSKADPIGYYVETMNLAKEWIEKGMKVNYKCFENSQHCSHFLKHPKDYTKEVAEYLDRIGLLKDFNKLPAFA